MTFAQSKFKQKIAGFMLLLGVIVFCVLGVSVFKAVAQTHDMGAAVATEVVHQEAAKATHPDIIKFAFLAAAIAVGVGSLGAGVAVGYVGAAAMGAIGEKPELAGRALIFVGLAEGIAIYGLIIAIMILGKI